MTLVTFTLPTAGLVSDRYEIEATDEGITIEHMLVDDTGFAEMASRATLMILPEALPRVIAELQRAQRAMVFMEAENV